MTFQEKLNVAFGVGLVLLAAVCLVQSLILRKVWIILRLMHINPRTGVLGMRIRK